MAYTCILYLIKIVSIATVQHHMPCWCRIVVVIVLYLHLQILKQETSRLESRSQLVTVCSLGPKVFMNCAGFIRITNATLNDRYYTFKKSSEVNVG